MKKLILILLLISSLALVLPVAAQNEDEVLILKFNRDFGYGGFGGEIQGRFSLQVQSPKDLVRAEYYLDGELAFEGTDYPFKWQFNTANFPDGRHTFSAIGYKANGTEIHADEFTRTFLSSDEAWNQVGDLIVPLLVLVGAITLVGVIGPVLLSRKKKHIPGVYGMAGGAVCPRCSFPYSRNVLSPNLLAGKLERCPHCGKWAIVARAPATVLQAAEARLASESQGTIETPSEEETLRQMIDDSRFDH